MTHQTASFVSSVLMHQPYIEDVRFTEEGPGKGMLDLNGFREYYHNKPQAWRSLPDTYFAWLKKKSDLSPWLDPVRCNFPPFAGSIIANRSLRYRNPDFPWSSIVHSFADRLLFAGTDEEFDDFVSRFGLVKRLVIRDLFEVYVWISSCALFIGNQSALRAVAEGLGVPVLMEGFLGAPDCDFKRPDVCSVYAAGDVCQAAEWLQKKFPEFVLLSQSARSVC